MKRLTRYIAALLSACMLLTTVSFAEVVNDEESEEVAVEQAAQQEDWRLLLVNPTHVLPEDFKVELTKLSNGMLVDKRIYNDLSAMLGNCCAAGLHPMICSAYRSTETQTRLHLNKIARLRAAGYGKETAAIAAARWVAVPGTSEHQTGLALDLVSANYQLLDHKQAETPEQKWLMEHCWEYGFILRYPVDKCEMTGIGYEPWHYRYVGREAAAEIREKGLCLEEYLDLLNGTDMEQSVQTQGDADAVTS